MTIVYGVTRIGGRLQVEVSICLLANFTDINFCDVVCVLSMEIAQLVDLNYFHPHTVKVAVARFI